MLDTNYIKLNKEELKLNMLNRGLEDTIVDELLKVEIQRSNLKKEIEKLNKEKNLNSSKLQSISDKTSVEAQNIIQLGKKIKFNIQQLNVDIDPIEKKFINLMYQIPNMVDPTMPIGKSSDDNVEIKVVGEKKVFTFKPKDHVEIGKILDIIDVDKSGKISGSRFGYLKNEAVLLEFAIIMYLTKLLVLKGYSPMIPPVLVKEEAMYGTGYFPIEKDQAYKIASDNVEDKSNLYLVGTAEVPTVAYHSGDIFEEAQLPKKYFSFSSAFRSEVGSWGKDVRGIKRVHQFDKLEMVIFALPEQSKEIHEELLSINEQFLQDLNLPYHVLNMCTGDVGYPTYKKYDVEVFLPSQNDYCETMSTSNIHSYQARRLNIKYKRKDGKSDFVHTLNATGAAMGRIILSILENYQQEDGSVKVPDALLPYLQDLIPNGIIKSRK